MKNYPKKLHYIHGLRSALPVILGFVPVGIAYAIMARQAGFSAAQTCVMSLTVFAGASQMMAVGMTEQGAAIGAVIIATFILNLRHFIMSTCVAAKMKGSVPAAKFFACFGVTDESFAIFTTEKEEFSTIHTFLGLITVTYLSWNAGTLIGAVASDFLPVIVTASLGVSLYAMFIGLLVPGLKGNRRLGLLVLITAICNTVLSQFMASGWSLIVSTLLCAFAGVFFVDLGEDGSERN